MRSDEANTRASRGSSLDTTREAVAETVKLLGVDVEHGDAAVQQRFDNRPMRRLDCNADLARLLGLAAQPIDHRADPGGVMANARWPGCFGSHRADLVCAARPVNADEDERFSVDGYLPLAVVPSRRAASPFPVLALTAAISQGATPHWAYKTGDRMRRA